MEFIFTPRFFFDTSEVEKTSDLRRHSSRRFHEKTAAANTEKTNNLAQQFQRNRATFSKPCVREKIKNHEVSIQARDSK